MTFSLRFVCDTKCSPIFFFDFVFFPKTMLRHDDLSHLFFQLTGLFFKNYAQSMMIFLTKIFLTSALSFKITMPKTHDDLRWCHRRCARSWACHQF